MTCTDIVTIIDACGRNAVTKLELDGVLVEFAPVAKTVQEWPTRPAFDNLDSGDSDIYNDKDSDQEEDDIQDEVDRLDELKFTDPELWDEYARRGEV